MICLKCRDKGEDSDMHYGLHLSCFKEWFQVTDAAEFESLQRRSAVSEGDVPLAPANTSFFHGKFKKYSAELDRHSYILKMRQENVEELPEVEYLCNQIGKHLNVPVAEFYYIDFHGDKTFVTKNFITSGSKPVDLQHIYHFRKDTEHSCEGIIQAVMENTKRPYDVGIIVKTILFDSLIANNDRHGRNLALIAKASVYVLSPIYDNVSYLALEQGEMLKADFNPTGKISTSTTFEPSMKDYVEELNKLGYKQETLEFYRSIELDEINKLIDESFCSDLMKGAIKRLVNKRYQELKNALRDH